MKKYKPRILEIKIYENRRLVCGTKIGVDPKLSNLTIFDGLKAGIFILEDLRKKESKNN